MAKGRTSASSLPAWHKIVKDRDRKNPGREKSLDREAACPYPLDHIGNNEVHFVASPEEGEAVEINVLAAGATEAVIRDTVGTFEKQSGYAVRLTYAPAGAIGNSILAGESADLVVTTPAVIDRLLAKGKVRPETRTDLGRVGGGIAVPLGAPRPVIGTPDELKKALLAAEEIYYADPTVATAGAYFLTVADRLGIGDAVRKKGRTAGGGKVSMELMAKSAAKTIGLTQISEILSVKEVALVGPYPGELQTMTTYAGILLKDTPRTEAAKVFLNFLMSSPVQARFKQAGYEPAQ
jgi:molybdate transport system substrate-binding protein